MEYLNVVEQFAVGVALASFKKLRFEKSTENYRFV